MQSEGNVVPDCGPGWVPTVALARRQSEGGGTEKPRPHCPATDTRVSEHSHSTLAINHRIHETTPRRLRQQAFPEAQANVRGPSDLLALAAAARPRASCPPPLPWAGAFAAGPRRGERPAVPRHAKTREAETPPYTRSKRDLRMGPDGAMILRYAGAITAVCVDANRGRTSIGRGRSGAGTAASSRRACRT